jgi:hypothetical protein
MMLMILVQEPWILWRFAVKYETFELEWIGHVIWNSLILEVVVTETMDMDGIAQIKKKVNRTQKYKE